MTFAAGPAAAPSSPPSDPRDGGAPRLRLVVPVTPTSAPAPDELNEWTCQVALNQDRAAFARLFEHFAPRMKNWLVRLGTVPALADEIVQDAFVVLWRKAAQFDPARADVAAWLFTIARNLRTDRHRGGGEPWQALDDAEVDRVADPTAGPDERASVEQQGRGVRLALAHLSPEQQELIRLSFYEDMSHSRIAVELSLPLGTVKTRLRRVASQLRQLLEEHRS